MSMHPNLMNADLSQLICGTRLPMATYCPPPPVITSRAYWVSPAVRETTVVHTAVAVGMNRLKQYW